MRGAAGGALIPRLGLLGKDNQKPQYRPSPREGGGGIPRVTVLRPSIARGDVYWGDVMTPLDTGSWNRTSTVRLIRPVLYHLRYASVCALRSMYSSHAGLLVMCYSSVVAERASVTSRIMPLSVVIMQWYS